MLASKWAQVILLLKPLERLRLVQVSPEVFLSYPAPGTLSVLFFLLACHHITYYIYTVCLLFSHLLENKFHELRFLKNVLIWVSQCSLGWPRTPYTDWPWTLRSLFASASKCWDQMWAPPWHPGLFSKNILYVWIACVSVHHMQAQKPQECVGFSGTGVELERVVCGLLSPSPHWKVLFATGGGHYRLHICCCYESQLGLPP